MARISTFYKLRSTLLAPLVLLMLWSCHSDQTARMKRPAGILPDSTMVAMMRDVALLEARVSLLKTNVDTAKAVFDSAFKLLLKQYHTDSLTFDSTLRYYGKNIQLMDDLYKKVSDSLSAMQPEKMRFLKK